jgi:hypothetical protein
MKIEGVWSSGQGVKALATLVEHGGHLSTVVRVVSHVYTVRSPAPNWRSNCGAQHWSKTSRGFNP